MIGGAPSAAAAARPRTAGGEYALAKTSVWWDINNCPVPEGCDPQLIVQNIFSALSSIGYKGTDSISSYVDTKKAADSVQNVIHSIGIGLSYVPMSNFGVWVFSCQNFVGNVSWCLQVWVRRGWNVLRNVC